MNPIIVLEFGAAEGVHRHTGSHGVHNARDQTFKKYFHFLTTALSRISYRKNQLFCVWSRDITPDISNTNILLIKCCYFTSLVFFYSLFHNSLPLCSAVYTKLRNGIMKQTEAAKPSK